MPEASHNELIQGALENQKLEVVESKSKVSNGITKLIR